MRQYSKGFTLVELVVVIAIIGILAGIAIPYYTDAQATARGAKVVADMRTIQAAYTMYLAKNGGDQKNIIVGEAEEYPDIIPMLVEKGYLESVKAMESVYYVTNKDDYKKPKILKLTKEEK